MRLPWPLPAVLAWSAAWLAFAALRHFVPLLPAVLLGCMVGVLGSVLAATWWRRVFIALGFPLSLLLGGAVALPGWAWLLPLAALLLVYPLNAWRDAPLFPTPRGALRGLEAAAPLPQGAAVLDAGCGLGHGLRALREAYPGARLHGLEWSRPLALLCRLRCPWARVRRGDIWAEDWGAYRLVYLFQRPESMERAAAKARAEMAAGSWLVSLAFEAPNLGAGVQLPSFAGHAVWVYQIGCAGLPGANARGNNLQESVKKRDAWL